MRSRYLRNALASIVITAALGTGVAAAADPPTLIQQVPNDGSVLVVWLAPAGNVTGYNVYQQVVTEPTADLPAATKVNADPIKETSLLVQGLTNGTCYHFTVSAIVDGQETDKAGPYPGHGSGGEFSDGKKVCVTPQKPTTIPGVTGNFVGMNIGTDFPGSHTVDANGVITIKASGWDIWNEGDGIYFLATPMSGDITMTARVVSGPSENPNGGGWEQGGPMIRETLDSRSRFAMLLISRANSMQFKKRVAFQEQPQNDDASQDDNTSRPVTLRIERKGDNFRAWFSVNGTSFEEVGSGVTIENFAKEPYVGLAFSAHEESTYSTVVVDNFKITSP